MTMVDFREALKARYVLTKILVNHLRVDCKQAGSDEHLIEFINKSEIELSKLVYREEE